MVAIPSYRGPTEWHNNDEVPLVPIVPSVTHWEKNERPCSRKQYPLRLAYAISIHKSQGMTLNKAVIEFGPKDFCRGLSFVALSCVRTLHVVVELGRRDLKGLRLKDLIKWWKIFIDDSDFHSTMLRIQQ